MPTLHCPYPTHGALPKLRKRFSVMARNIPSMKISGQFWRLYAVALTTMGRISGSAPYVLISPAYQSAINKSAWWGVYTPRQISWLSRSVVYRGVTGYFQITKLEKPGWFREYWKYLAPQAAFTTEFYERRSVGTVEYSWRQFEQE